jgi:hypothetical protein
VVHCARDACSHVPTRPFCMQEGCSPCADRREPQAAWQSC